MVEEIQSPQVESEELSDEQALMKIAQAMKDNAPSQDEKHNIYTFLQNVVTTKDTTKVGNLRDDKQLNELGLPIHTVRGSKELALISKKIMNNKYFEEYFNQEAEDTLATSLSREGFLIKVSQSQTKQIVDATRRVKRNKGMFKSSTEYSGGDINSPNIEQG